MCVCVGVCGCAVCGCVVCVVWVAHISIVKTKKLRFFRTIFPRYNWYSKSSLTKESCTFDHHILHVFFQVFQCTFLYWEACHKCHVLQGKNDQKS